MWNKGDGDKGDAALFQRPFDGNQIANGKGLRPLYPRPLYP